MQKFSEWLQSNKGMAASIARQLGISRTNLTNTKTGRLLMPTGWMETIVKLSKGKLSYKDLVQEREIHRIEKKLTRQSNRKQSLITTNS